ncbi:hypothetical protein Q668_18765 [Alcanivorax sp. PN-3]|nr:hypothetical protein Q668_18765 [Alcanivorax sp. PN-3]
MQRCVAALAAVAMGMGVSVAHGEAYVSLGYGYHEQDDRFFGDDRFETGDLIAKLGGRINRWFAVEMRGGSTLNSNEDRLNGTSVKGEYRQKYFYGAYVKLSGPNATMATPYLIGGYTEGKEEMDVDGGGKVTDKWYDSSYGLGIDFGVSERFDVNVEYMFYRDKDNVTLKGPALSASWTF